MFTPRRIIVDDTDASINYGAGQWFPHDPNQLDLGNLGPIWNNTTHSTSTNATVSFAFNGTSITAAGTIQVATDSDGNVDPTWTCLVDDIEIPFGNSPTFAFPENNWVLCTQPTLNPGSHNLTIKVQSKGQPFYLDDLLYTPTEDISYDGAVLEYLAGDPAITYGSGWEFFAVEDTENITLTHGSQVSFAFHGTAVVLSGFISHNLSHNATTASYAVDGGPTTTFTLSGLAPTSTTSLFNMPLLSVDSLSPGAHNLVVTYEGDSTKTPLAVKTIYVTNSTTPSRTSKSPTSSAPSAESPTTTQSASSNVSKHSDAGAIAGAITASIVVLALVVGLLFWFRRRRRRELSEKFMIAGVEAGTALGAVVPFTDYAAATSSTSPKIKPIKPIVFIQRHQDSGMRLNTTPSMLKGRAEGAPEIVELPPDYSQE